MNEILEGNKLIAEFMGMTKTETTQGIFYTTTSDPYEWHETNLTYHHDWKMLMPVVEKICKTNSIGIAVTWDIELQWNIVVSFIKSNTQSK